MACGSHHLQDPLSMAHHDRAVLALQRRLDDGLYKRMVYKVG